MIFKIIPRFNSFQNGDLIQYGDEVKVQCSKTEFYLAINYNETFSKIVNFEINNPHNKMNLANLNLQSN